MMILSGAAIVACGRARAPAVDSATSSPVATARAPSSAGAACPRTGHWSECQVRIRLEQSGLAPRVTTEKAGDLPVLDGAGKPLTFMVGNAGLALYIYPDTATRHRAAASLDTTTFIPQSRPIGMRGETTVIQNDNLLALLFSRNEHQRERVSDAITAGAPQP